MSLQITCTAFCCYLYDCLQFPSITQSVLDGHLTDFLLALAIRHSATLLLHGKVDSAVFNDPTLALSELNDCTFALEEEKVLRG